MVLEVSKPSGGFGYAHSADLAYVLTVDIYVESFPSKPPAVTFSTGGLASKTREHNSVLYLAVLLFFEHLKEVVQTVKPAVAGPDESPLLRCELAERRMNWKIEMVCVVDELVAPSAHLLASPAEDGIVIYAERLVGNDEVGVDTYDVAEAAAYGAGS